MLDENRWLAVAPRARRRAGRPPELRPRADAGRSPAASSTACAPHAQDLGSEAELDGIDDLLERGNGAHRQRVVYEANHDLHEVVREIAEASIPE